MLDEIRQAVTDGDEAGAAEKAQAALDGGTAPSEVLDALSEAIREIGERFQRGEAFLPEMMLAADAMKAAVAVVQPALLEADVDVAAKGKVVVGTIQHDIHDIGKNIVALAFETNGYEVVDLGIDVPVARFADEYIASGADVVGASAMITSTLPALRRVVSDVRAKAPHAKVLIGGAPVTPALVAEYGSDAYAGDAIEAVRAVDALLSA